MSTYFYESDSLSIDVTPDFVWFFDGVGDVYVRAPRNELPAIHKAMGEYLREVEER